MRRKKKERRKRKHGGSFFGMGEVSSSSSSKNPSVKETAKESGLALLSAIGGTGVGAALGRHSLLPGLVVFVWGIHKKNPYITAAGLGLSLSNGFQRPGQPVQGMDGFDIKQI